MSNIINLKFLVDNNNSTIVRFNNEEIIFSMSYYRKGNRENRDVSVSSSPYLEFNTWLSSKDVRWQEEIFAYYKDIRNIISNINDVEVLIIELNKVFIQLYSTISLAEVRDWVNSGVCINVPVKTNVVNINNIKEKTYTREDYTNLVAYSLLLRFVAPIWGEIMNRLGSYFGKTAKETFALELLAHTELMGCEAHLRLEEYIDSIKEEFNEVSVIVTGGTPEDYIRHMLSFIVLKKLALGDISCRDSNYNLIKDIYYQFKNKLKIVSTYGSDNDGIQIKKQPSDYDGDENNSQSILDTSSSRIKFTMEDLVFLKRCIKDHERLISVICPDLPMELYRESMDNLFALRNMNNELRQFIKPIQDCQINIIKWVLDDAINIDILDYLKLDEIIDVIGLIRAILWYKGFKDLAVIVSAISIPISENIAFIPSFSRRNINADVMTKLNNIFPYTGDTKSEKRNMSPVYCIDLIEKSIDDFGWEITIPKSWIKELDDNSIKHNQYVPSNNLRNIIAELMIYSATISENHTANYHLFK